MRCVWTAGELKTITERRECLAGQCAPRPGAEPKMTSNGLWPLLRKYENGKIAGKSPVCVLHWREKNARVGEERERTNEKDREWNYKGHFWEANSSARPVLCAHATTCTTKMNVLEGFKRFLMEMKWVEPRSHFVAVTWSHFSLQFGALWCATSVFWGWKAG